jgi:hypothetical protein
VIAPALNQWQLFAQAVLLALQEAQAQREAVACSVSEEVANG